jgi:transposase
LSARESTTSVVADRIRAQHAARLRGAITGKNKSDVIDTDVLARAGEVFTLTPLRVPAQAQLALRRVCTRRARR